MEIKPQSISKKERFARIMSLISVMGFAAGLAVTFTSATLARSAGNAAVRANFGSMDTAQFLLVIENSARAYVAAGVVLALIGGIGLLISAVMLYKSIEN